MRRLIDKVALVLSVSMYHMYEVVARIYHTKNNLNNVFIYHLMIKYNNTTILRRFAYDNVQELKTDKCVPYLRLICENLLEKTYASQVINLIFIRLHSRTENEGLPIPRVHKFS